MDEAYNQDEAILSKIEELGGDDGEYKSELKTHVTNALGYSNYMNKLGAMPPAYSPDYLTKMGKGVEPKFKGTPSGNAASANAGINLVEQERGYLESLTKKSKGTKAEQLEAENEAFKGLLNFEAQDELDNAIKNELDNPFSEEGVFRDVDDMRQDLIDMKNPDGTAMYSESQIDQRLNQRIPEQYREDFQEKYYMAVAGATEKDAENMVNNNRLAKGEMSPTEIEMRKRLNPTWGKQADIIAQSPEVQGDLNKIMTKQAITDDSGNEINKYADFVSKYKDKIDEASLKEIAEPAFKFSIKDDIDDEMDKIKIEISDEIGVLGFLARDKVKDLKVHLENAYAGLYTSSQVEGFIIDYYEKKKDGLMEELDKEEMALKEFNNQPSPSINPSMYNLNSGLYQNPTYQEGERPSGLRKTR